MYLLFYYIVACSLVISMLRYRCGLLHYLVAFSILGVAFSVFCSLCMSILPLFSAPIHRIYGLLRRHNAPLPCCPATLGTLLNYLVACWILGVAFSVFGPLFKAHTNDRTLIPKPFWPDSDLDVQTILAQFPIVLRPI